MMRGSVLRIAFPRLAVGLLALVTFSAGTFVAAPSARPEAVSLPFRAEKGDRFRVRVTKRVAESKGGEQTNDGPFSFNYDGDVLQASESGYLIRWTLKSVFTPGSKADNAALSSGILAMMKDIPLEFDAGLNGAPVRIPNFKDILPRLLQLSRKFLTEDGQEPDPQVMKRVEDSYNAMSLEAAAGHFLPEAALIGGMQNLRLDRGAPARKVTAQPSPLGGPPIKMITETRLATHDALTGVAVVKWETRFDPRSIADSTAALMESMRKPGDPDLPPEAREMLKQIKIERIDTGTAMISLADGWVRKIHYRQFLENKSPGQDQSKDEIWLVEIDRK